MSVLQLLFSLSIYSETRRRGDDVYEHFLGKPRVLIAATNTRVNTRL